jgi:hypothetical protein
VGLVQVLTGNGTMRPFILVGIENTARRRDLTGPTTSAEDRKIAPQVGGSAAFRQFIRTELMPVIRQRYRTSAETAIIGESLAGLFVLETFLQEPDLFDTYVAFDPSLWWNKGWLVDQAPAKLRAYAGPPKTLYVASSSDDAQIPESRRLEPALKAAAKPTLRWYYKPSTTRRPCKPCAWCSPPQRVPPNEPAHLVVRGAPYPEVRRASAGEQLTPRVARLAAIFFSVEHGYYSPILRRLAAGGRHRPDATHLRQRGRQRSRGV